MKKRFWFFIFKFFFLFFFLWFSMRHLSVWNGMKCFLFWHLPLSLPFDLYNLWWLWRTKVLDLFCCYSKSYPNVLLMLMIVYFCFSSHPLSTNRFSTLIFSFVHNLHDQYRKTPPSPPSPSFVPVLFLFCFVHHTSKVSLFFCIQTHNMLSKAHTHTTKLLLEWTFLLFILFFK